MKTQNLQTIALAVALTTGLGYAQNEEESPRPPVRPVLQPQGTPAPGQEGAPANPRRNWNPDNDPAVTPQSIMEEQILIIELMVDAIADENGTILGHILEPGDVIPDDWDIHIYMGGSNLADVISRQDKFNKRYQGSQKAKEAGRLMRNSRRYQAAVAGLERAVADTARMADSIPDPQPAVYPPDPFGYYEYVDPAQIIREEYDRLCQDIDKFYALLGVSPVYAAPAGME